MSSVLHTHPGSSTSRQILQSPSCSALLASPHSPCFPCRWLKSPTTSKAAGTKRHGQKLLQGHDGVLAQLVVHQYRRVGLQHLVSKTIQTCESVRWRLTYIAELADELPAHATRAGRRRNVGGDCDGAEIACFSSLIITSSVHRLVCRQLYVTTYMLRHSVTNRDSLRACSNRIRGILDVGAGDDGAAGKPPPSGGASETAPTQEFSRWMGIDSTG